MKTQKFADWLRPLVSKQQHQEATQAYMKTPKPKEKCSYLEWQEQTKYEAYFLMYEYYVMFWEYVPPLPKADLSSQAKKVSDIIDI